MGASFRLSNEELALLCSLLGKPGFAYRVLGIADRSVNLLEDEVQHARLLTAGHGLMARYALLVGIDGTITLSETLITLGQIFTNADFVLEFSRADESGEWQMALCFYQGQIWEHITEAGVVHEFRQLTDLQEVFMAAEEFFQLPEEEGNDPVRSWEVSLGSFQDVEQFSSVEQIVRWLEQGGLSSELAQSLASDIQRATFRGSILRNRYDDGVLIASQGGILISGNARYWLLEIPEQTKRPGEVTIQPFSRKRFQQLMTQWTASGE